MQARILFLCGSLFCYLSGSGQPENLSPQQQLLSMFAGHWTIEGSEATYLEVCDWIQGNHIQCLSTSTEGEITDRSISYLTYSSSENTYLYYGIYGSGSSRTLRGNWENGALIFEGHRVSGEKQTNWKVTITPVDQDLHFKQEVSINGGTWETNADFMYKRIQ